MIRLAIVLSLAVTPVLAASDADKAESCRYQAEVVAAIQQARLKRVRERKVPDAIAATNPTWPENYNAAISLITPWVYEKKMRILRKEDLGAAWKELCLLQ
jgi:hypothetical protein